MRRSAKRSSTGKPMVPQLPGGPSRRGVFLFMELFLRLRRWWRTPRVGLWITKFVFLVYALVFTATGGALHYFAGGSLLFSLVFYVLGAGLFWIAANSERLVAEGQQTRRGKNGARTD